MGANSYVSRSYSRKLAEGLFCPPSWIGLKVKTKLSARSCPAALRQLNPIQKNEAKVFVKKKKEFWDMLLLLRNLRIPSNGIRFCCIYMSYVFHGIFTYLTYGKSWIIWKKFCIIWYGFICLKPYLELTFSQVFWPIFKEMFENISNFIWTEGYCALLVFQTKPWLSKLS